MIEGFCILDYKCSEDERGTSIKFPVTELLSPNEIFISSSRKGVIRGMHYQVEPYLQKKLIYVIKGRIQGVVLDMRPESDTYKHHESIFLHGGDNKCIIVPDRCAWGFETFDDENILLYAIEGVYSRECERGIRYDSFGFEWETIRRGDNPIVSIRDKEDLPPFSMYD